MKEYTQLTISSEAEMNHTINYMRLYGWVYTGANAVGFSDHHLTGMIINGYGGFGIENEHSLGINLRFVRDTEMPHYEDLKNLYNKALSLGVFQDDPEVPQMILPAKILFIMFMCFGLLFLISGLIVAILSNVSAGGIELVFIIIGAVLSIVFFILLIAQTQRYKKAMKIYNSHIKSKHSGISKVHQKLDKISQLPEIVNFLNNLEKTLTVK